MMRTLVLYGHPEDPEAFERHYEEVHAPLVLRMPLLEGFRTSHGPVTGPDGGGPYHLIAELDFASAAVM